MVVSSFFLLFLALFSLASANACRHASFFSNSSEDLLVDLSIS